MRKSCSRRSFLSDLQTSQGLHISMNAQMTYEPIVLEHFQPDGNFFSRDLFADVMSVNNRDRKHARAIKFDKTNLLAMLYVLSRVRKRVDLKCFKSNWTSNGPPTFREIF